YFTNLNGHANLFQPSANAKFCKDALHILMDEFGRIFKIAEIHQVVFMLDDFYFLVTSTPIPERPNLAAEIRSIAVDGQYYATQQNLYTWMAVLHTMTAPRFEAAWANRGLQQIAPIQFNLNQSLALQSVPFSQGRLILEAYLNYKRPSRAPDRYYPFTQDA